LAVQKATTGMPRSRNSEVLQNGRSIGLAMAEGDLDVSASTLAVCQIRKGPERAGRWGQSEYNYPLGKIVEKIIQK
jgi:hypothetical protein